MENNEVEQEKELNDQLNEIENLFSNLIIGLNEIDEIGNNDEKDIERKINHDDNQDKDIINIKEVVNNVKDIKEGYPKNINRRYHYTISNKLEEIELLNNGNSIHRTAEKLGVDPKTIKWWKEHENDYNKITNPSIKKKLYIKEK